MQPKSPVPLNSLHSHLSGFRVIQRVSSKFQSEFLIALHASHAHSRETHAEGYAAKPVLPDDQSEKSLLGEQIESAGWSL